VVLKNLRVMLDSLKYRLALGLTRGSRFKLIERGLYVPSRRWTERWAASPGIPAGLVGHAWVRVGPGLLFGNRLRAIEAILVNGFGRFGNSIIQLLNARTLADRWNVPTVLFHRFDLIENRNIDLAPAIRLEKTSVAGRKARPPRLIWATYALRGASLIEDGCSPGSDSVRAILSDAVAVAPSVALPTEDRVLTVHIRSGDIFGTDPHQGYGQPPLSFYQKVVLASDWDRVDIISEDMLNPCSTHLEVWCRDQGIPVSSNCLQLSETIARIAQAKNVVAGRGTFIPSIVFLFPRARAMYLFEPDLEPLLCDPQLKTHQVTDTQGEYLTKILKNNWTNSHEQRHLMLNYPAKFLSPVAPWTRK